MAFPFAAGGEGRQLSRPDRKPALSRPQALISRSRSATESEAEGQPATPEGGANSPWMDRWCSCSYRGWRISSGCSSAAVGEERPPGRSGRRPAFQIECKETNSNPQAKAHGRSESTLRASELRTQAHPATTLLQRGAGAGAATCGAATPSRCSAGAARALVKSATGPSPSFSSSRSM